MTTENLNFEDTKTSQKTLYDKDVQYSLFILYVRVNVFNIVDTYTVHIGFR
jgi:hypothetical protein